MPKTLVIILLLLIACPALAQNRVDTFSLYFDLNIAPLNKNTEKKIDLLIYNDKIINGSSIMIIGYADYLGSEGYNKNLSMLRAKNVKEYLVKYGIEANDIKVCIGKGKVERKEITGKEGSPIDRRVDIVVNNKAKNTETITKRSESITNLKRTINGKQGSNSTETAAISKHKKDTSKLAFKQKVTDTKTDIKDITKLKEGQTLRLKNVYFPPGSHVIKPESYETIEKLVKILHDNPNLKISIEGHVCCIHDVPDALDIDTNELLLSLNRAKAIYAYLVEKGIDESRLQYVGFGRQHPIVPFEETEEDADKNRRVEIRVTSVN